MGKFMNIHNNNNIVSDTDYKTWFIYIQVGGEEEIPIQCSHALFQHKGLPVGLLVTTN